ncbi:putative DNA-directed RNA polymerase I largest subunit [Neospora caninum Liverpool]|uniref:DNA-directed RNA polymerase subunit n=1 Tax=Neospora caninum (strain Liverpool) TaxID=572307 RepID=F0VEK1_NEOCL|nr:putative DNA-directed RNA polymerase I largest subunit [Neospora caninum Liverpool]CBZ52145.1 putative DNA-directed RNA polymerase I largest subunit [Neospora caninum Liverpool]CEL66108.1 TPA: DNA-directed rna polymerase I largest subunit,putative [Neospora caninum Liverpool]|eukprot:XP_003882177.1 putative DNA-directed RNA polymerase I largest subunit [Neospora caninum Liverpool]
MYDANSTICSSVHSASLTLFSQEEVRTLSSCRISDTNVFLDPHASSSSLSATFTAARGGGPEAVSGGLHDARLGSLDGREICETCGCRSDCPGHLGHIDLALPVFQPIFLPSLVKVLKLSCLHCERLRVSPAAAALFVKAFELLQLGCFDAVDEASRCASSALRSGARGVSAAFSLPPSQRVAVLRIFEKIDQELQRRGGAHPNVSAASAPASPPRKDCGERHDAVEEPEPDESEDAHSAARRTKRDAAGAETDRAEDAKEQQRVANLLRESTDFEKEENRLLLETFGHDISGSAWQVSTWRKLRDLLWTRAAASALCANCGRSNAVTFHVAQQSTGVEMRWKWTGTPPFDKNSAFFSFVRNATKRPGREEESEGRKKDDGRDDAAALFDERCLTYGKSGRAIGKLHLHAFQLMPMLQNVFKNSVDRRLLHCLFPMSIRLSSSCFFISSLPVSANKFRPPLAGGAAFGREGGGMPLLHPRTATLLELLKINEKVQFALTIMRHPDPTGALENPECWGELFGYSVATQEAGPDEEEKPPKKKRTDGDDEGEKAKAKGKVAESKSAAASVLSPEEQQKLKEFVLVHAAGNAAWLTSYAVQLQQKVNEIVDKTKAEKPLTAPAGIRQWMERKAGTIRQKLMGKRVNYAARTVLAPDALIATNEVGVPLDFAMKLSIPEKVTPRNVHVLSEMVINGPHKHPGALAIMDDAGNLFNLEFLSPATRRAKAHQLLLSASSSSSSLSPSSSDMPTTNGSFTVYRHVLDGDAVLMNRQPSLHRVSLMGHFVKITRGVSSVYHINDYLIRNNLLHLLVERKSAQSKLKALKNASGSDKREVGDEDEASRKKARKTEKKSLIHFSGLFKKKKTEKPSEEEEERKHDHDEERGLTKENVFRLNFVNCSSYNADFDGDEMNMHLPQDHVARTEAAYILNADCHFLVPKSGEPLRGLIQDLCLAGCLLTARDTFLDIHSFQTLVYSGLSCYLDSGPGRIILDRGRKALSRLHASEVASPASGKKEGDPETGSEEGRERFKAPGDPYRRQLIEQTRRGNSRLHMEPPAILWPKPLWTGKQVITCILKTLVDGMAASRFSQCRASGQGKGGLGSGGGDEEGEDALNRYEGVNLTGKAKTPGDAWGGAEDGDKEEEVVIIRNSELLQGVFDKAQFGPTAGGLVHCVFLLFGGAAAGLLLQSLAALFCAFLKLRSATTSPADFVMRREGELQRQALVRQVIQAGTYLQEHFTSRMNALMGWHDDGRDNPLLPTLSASCSHEPTGAECEGGLAKDEKTHVLSKDTALLKMAAASVAPKDEAKESEMSGDDAGQDELSAALEGALKVEKLNLARLSDAAAYALRLLGTGTACEDAAEPQSPSADTEAHKGKAARVKHEAGAYAEDSKDLAKHQGKDSLESPAATSALLPASSLNPWILSRYLKTPELLAASGTLPTRRRMCEELRRLIEILTHVQKTGSPSARKELLCFLACSPSLQQQLPHLAKVLGTDRLLPVQQRLRTTHPTQGSQDETPQAPFLHPPANHMVSLPNGAAIQGDAALLQKRLYHPSWLWEGGEEAGSKSAETESSDAAYSVAANIFEGTERYVLKGAKNAGIGGGEGGAQLRTFLMPSLLTVRRIGALYTSHFRGREDTFNEMLDAFFQSAMGKVASKSTDIMKGSYFLYRFPRNGFASMIKSGSKGSNVNFAMISVFLGQQSLEGQRVKFMTSDRSLPAFLPFDFGSRARGFITSSFLSGLKEEEYFFHCMAGREGLVDTAVKTAKSGYLQRSVTKGLEALTVRYDGSVRDADDSIVQFVYGDDGRDPAHRLTFEKIDMLLENPAILQRVHAPPSQLGSRPPERRLELAGGHGKNAEAKAQDEDIDTDSTADSDCLVQEYGSPLTRLGVTAFQFENDMQRLVDKAVARYETLRAAYSRTQDTSRQKKKRKATGHGVSEAVARDTRIGLEKDELEKILRVIYHKCCMPPGEAVGCVAAQSIGEPATQMTLNTFHLAGHGAANVTMGIPRLRELLQQGAVTKTPILYIPLRTAANPREDSPGADPEEREVDQGRVLVRNAGMALRSFTSIGLADCVHSVGVEANVCYQPPNCPKGCPAFHLPPYVSRSNSPNQLTAPSSRLYWQYEVCLQLENLSHFSQVVKSFAPAQICTLVLRKVIRPFLKKAHRLMVAAVAHHGRTDFAEVRSDLQAFFQNAICQDNKLTQWDHRSKVKEILRTARVGDSAAGEATDELFSAGASRAGNQEEREEGDNKRTETDADEKEADGSDRASSADEEEKEEKSDEEGEAENDELPDGRVSESEQSGAPSDDDQERSKTRSTKSEKRGVSSASGDAGVKAEQVTDEDESSGSGDEDATSSEDEDDPEDDGRSGKTGGKSLNADMLAKGEVSRGGRPRADAFESMFSPLLLSFARLVKGESFDMNTHLFFPQDKKQGSKTKRPIAVPAPVESDALWADGRKYKGFVLITREVASILHEVLVCPRTWRIILKFGWPFERCPYRLELLPLLMGLLKKCKMQEPEGVAAPRIVQGEGCVTKQKVEIQCEGSNFGWIHRMKDEAIDHNGILTNDVRAVLKYYGIEAARVCLARELERVFSAYGIKVDYRHLTLIADFMTHDGTLRPFNRLGMAASNAPFLQMSYETSFKFLTEACERAAVDSLSTPSGSLVVGTPSVIGSQQHQVFTQLHPALHRQRDLFKLSRKGNGVSQGDSTGNAKDEPEALVSRIKKKLVKSAHEDDKPSSRMNTDAPEIDRGEVAGGQEGTGVKREKSSHRHKERRDSALSNEAFNPGENGGDDEAKKKKKRKRKAFDFI